MDGREPLVELGSLTTRHLKKDDEIRLTGLGILQVLEAGRHDGVKPGDG